MSDLLKEMLRISQYHPQDFEKAYNALTDRQKEALSEELQEILDGAIAIVNEISKAIGETLSDIRESFNKFPRVIYLQFCEEHGINCDDEITWCQDKINDSDKTYILLGDEDE